MATGLRTYTAGGQTLMHHSLTQSVYLEGLPELKKAIRFDELLAQPWSAAMMGLVEGGVQTGRSQAPVGHLAAKKGGKNKPRKYSRHAPGQLREKLYARWAKGKFMGWAAVRSRGTQKGSKGAYPYPRMLNYSQKHNHVGWFDRGVIEPVMARAGAELDAAANHIARKWGG